MNISSLRVRDISQAFINSGTFLRRDIYVRVLKELRLPKDYVLHVIRPLYGLPESPLHWFTTYRGHHKIALKMKSTAVDICLLHKTEDGKLKGLVGMLVDDSVVSGTKEFMEQDDLKSRKFPNKVTEEISTGETSKLTYNGCIIGSTNDGLYLKPTAKKLTQIQEIDVAGMEYGSFCSARARCAYHSQSTVPAALALVATLSHVTSSNFKAVHMTMLQRAMDIIVECGETMRRTEDIEAQKGAGLHRSSGDNNARSLL